MKESEAIKEIETSIELAKMCTQNIERTKEIEAYAMAIKALEKQIPKKPEEMDCIGFDTLVCPKCKMALYLYEPYCDNCGQKIDWSDEE